MMHFGYMGMGIEFIILKLFCLTFFLGIILFMVWAIRTLNKKQLKKWVVGMLLIGLVGMIASSLLLAKNKDSVKWEEWKADKFEMMMK